MKEILLVEATPALLTSRVKTLERQGYHVTGASTAGEVAKAMKQESYALLIVGIVTAAIGLTIGGFLPLYWFLLALACYLGMIWVVTMRILARLESKTES